MTSTIRGNAAATHWDFVEGVQGVVLIARDDDQPLAIIELCPRAGFRLTDCGDGLVGTFMSLEEAKQAFEDRRSSATKG